MSKLANGNTYVKQIDGLRFFAVMLVALQHWVLNPMSLEGVFPSGMIGVTLFFVLSGFLITTILLLSKASEGKSNGKQIDAAAKDLSGKFAAAAEDTKNSGTARTEFGYAIGMDENGNISASHLVSSCSERYKRNRRKFFSQETKLHVFRAEIMTPTADAMGFINSYH